MEGIPQGTPLISELTLQRTITEVQLDNIKNTFSNGGSKKSFITQKKNVRIAHVA